MDIEQYSELIPWINFGVMVISTILMTFFYLRSARPAQLEKQIGPVAYQKCGQYRVIASIFEMVIIATYVIYYFYPLPIPIPQTFPWPHWISLLVAVAIGVPSGYVMYKGVLAAGVEGTMPKKKGQLFGGIYRKIRHPQAMGELPLWWSGSLILNSPFLALYSIVMIPIFVGMAMAEEKDLMIRYGKKYADYKARTGFIIPKRS
jgi:protein-S-isoprenylcysteine O-methyltransferase Ste14